MCQLFEYQEVDWRVFTACALPSLTKEKPRQLYLRNISRAGALPVACCCATGVAGGA